QAEDGIRDRNVTGVQTCALPISLLGGIDITVPDDIVVEVSGVGLMGAFESNDRDTVDTPPTNAPTVKVTGLALMGGVNVVRKPKIGRASCRERVEIGVQRGAVEG